MGSQTYTAEPGQAITIGTTILTPGGPAATISGETISLEPSGIVIDGTTLPFSEVPTSLSNLVETEAPFTVSGTAYTAYEMPGKPGQEIIVGPDGIITTITVGGLPVTIAGQVVSAVPDGVEVRSSDIPFVTLTARVENEAIFPAGGHVHTAIEEPSPSGSSEIAVIDGSITLTEGGPGTTIGGESVSFGSDGLVFNGTSTESWTRVTVGPNNSPISIPTAAIPSTTQAILGPALPTSSLTGSSLRNFAASFGACVMSFMATLAVAIT